MKYLPNIAGFILGLLFFAFGIMILLNLVTPPPEALGAEGTPLFMFNHAFMSTGYMKFVKAFEVLGGILVAIPRTRNFGLLILGPIIINILAFTIFIANGNGLLAPPNVIIVVLAAYLLWVGRRAFAGLLNSSANAPKVGSPG